MKFWNDLNPKIRNAAIAAVVLGAVSVLNSVVNVYPDQAWTPIVDSVILLITGWYTPSPKPAAKAAPRARKKAV